MRDSLTPAETGLCSAGLLNTASVAGDTDDTRTTGSNGEGNACILRIGVALIAICGPTACTVQQGDSRCKVNRRDWLPQGECCPVGQQSPVEGLEAEHAKAEGASPSRLSHSIQCASRRRFILMKVTRPTLVSLGRRGNW